MNKFLYALVIMIGVGLMSCRKTNNDIAIQQYDDDQIQAYIKQNGLTAMQRDKTDGDTTGIYYQILNKGTGPVVDYPDKISYTYSYSTFDGKYAATDTILNHVNNYLGHVTPNAIQLSIKNVISRLGLGKGTKVRLLVPSRLAFGRNGYFAGAVSISGNQCLDYTINLINDNSKDQAKYDDLSIRNYIAANGLTGFGPPTKDGLYYKIVTPSTGIDTIGDATVVGIQNNASLLNNNQFENYTQTDQTLVSTSFSLYDAETPGLREGLKLVKSGAKIILLVPSALAFGQAGSSNSATGVSVPAFSCIKYEIQVVSVTN
jgi:FKBP-type peptidyl-prolyl cis-trans isomerase FkpA